MSRQIDMKKPLSPADMRYLMDRDRHREVAFSAVFHDTALPEDVEQSILARGITYEEIRADVRAARGESPEDASGAPNGAEGASEAPAGSAGRSGDEKPSDDGPALYSDEWFDKATIAMLTPHLEKYGLSKTGKRDELADRLYEKLIDENVISDEEEDSDAEGDAK